MQKCKIKSVKHIGRLPTYSVEMNSKQHNYAVYGIENVGKFVISANSHCVAYGYISSRMLYLKCHHPLEFYTSVLSCVNPTGPKDYDRVKDYKREAERHGICVERLDINKSGYNHTIRDGKIYYGFSKIKGIGEDVAKRIVEYQPYKNFLDFLERFGTDTKVVTAMLALRQFNEADNVTLFKFYLSYRLWLRKKEDRERRYKQKMDKYKAMIQQLKDENADPDEIKKIAEKALKSHATFAAKNPAKPTVDYFEEVEMKEADLKYIPALTDQERAEKDFYGFVWQHPLERYSKNCFSATKFKEEGLSKGPLEILISEVKEMTSKKGSKYYSVVGEDVEGTLCRVTVWENDYEVFKDSLKVNNMVRLVVDAPKPPFPGFTLHSERWKKDPLAGSRVVLIER